MDQFSIIDKNKEMLPTVGRRFPRTI
jgi:hypothetical protein